MVNEFDLPLDDGSTLHAYDTGGADRLGLRHLSLLTSAPSALEWLRDRSV